MSEVPTSPGALPSRVRAFIPSLADAGLFGCISVPAALAMVRLHEGFIKVFALAGLKLVLQDKDLQQAFIKYTKPNCSHATRPKKFHGQVRNSV